MKTSLEVGFSEASQGNGAAQQSLNGSIASSARAQAGAPHVLLIKRRLLWRRVTKWAAGPFPSRAEAVKEGERVLAEIRRRHGRDEEETYLFSVEGLVTPGDQPLPPEFRPFL